MLTDLFKRNFDEEILDLISQYFKLYKKSRENLDQIRN